MLKKLTKHTPLGVSRRIIQQFDSDGCKTAILLNKYRQAKQDHPERIKKRINKRIEWYNGINHEDIFVVHLKHLWIGGQDETKHDKNFLFPPDDIPELTTFETPILMVAFGEYFKGKDSGIIDFELVEKDNITIIASIRVNSVDLKDSNSSKFSPFYFEKTQLWPAKSVHIKAHRLATGNDFCWKNIYYFCVPQIQTKQWLGKDISKEI